MKAILIVDARGKMGLPGTDKNFRPLGNCPRASTSRLPICHRFLVAKVLAGGVSNELGFWVGVVGGQNADSVRKLLPVQKIANHLDRTPNRGL